MKILIVLALLFLWLAISTWLGCRIGAFLDDGENQMNIIVSWPWLYTVTWEPSKEAVERAANEIHKWLEGFRLSRGAIEDIARAALIAGHEDAPSDLAAAEQRVREAEKEENARLREALEQAYTVLSFAFNRIHVLPRSRDTELASDIGKVRAQIAAALKGEKSK